MFSATGQHPSHHAVRLDLGALELAAVILLGVADFDAPELELQNVEALGPDLVAANVAQHVEHCGQAGIRAQLVATLRQADEHGQAGEHHAGRRVGFVDIETQLEDWAVERLVPPQRDAPAPVRTGDDPWTWGRDTNGHGVPGATGGQRDDVLGSRVDHGS